VAAEPICDPYGRALGKATLPGGSATDCHDGCSEAVFSTIESAGLRMERAPSGIFDTLIPASSLVGPGAPSRIIPDGFVDVALPKANPPRQGGGQRPKRGDAEPLQRHLLDVKTIYAGTTYYRTARARDEQCGAVDHRAERVHPAYVAHARKLDERCYRCPSCPRQRAWGRCAACDTRKPIQDRLAHHGTVRGLVVGAYGECSLDIHSLVEASARESARRLWRRYGARTEGEAYSFFVAALRRQVGVAVVREFARHRLRRLHFIGMTRAEVAAARRAADQRPATPGALGPDASEFYVYQAGLAAGGAAAGAA